MSHLKEPIEKYMLQDYNNSYMSLEGLTLADKYGLNDLRNTCLGIAQTEKIFKRYGNQQETFKNLEATTQVEVLLPKVKTASYAFQDIIDHARGKGREEGCNDCDYDQRRRNDYNPTISCKNEKCKDFKLKKILEIADKQIM